VIYTIKSCEFIGKKKDIIFILPLKSNGPMLLNGLENK